MPFEPAIKLMQDYHTKHAAQLWNVDRVSWSTTAKATLKELQETFSTTQENKTWAAEMAKSKGQSDLNVSAQTRVKIAWLCGCRRDVRIQYIASESRVRSATDHVRFQHIMGVWANHGVQRFYELANQVLPL